MKTSTQNLVLNNKRKKNYELKDKFHFKLNMQ